MIAKKRKRKPAAEPTTAQENLEFLDVSQERSVDEVVESFSRGFEKDLRRILGDRYQERPKDGE